MESAPLIALLVLVLAILAGRAITRERREFARFRRLRSTIARQKVYRRWLVESVAIIGGLAVVLLVGAGSFVDASLASAQSVPAIAAARSWLATGLGTGIAIGAAIGGLVGLVLPILLLRRTPIDEIPAIGDIRALLPRTRGELPYGAGLALSAGVFEELLFRLALPALLFGITGEGLLSIVAASALFGLLHLYQGPVGVAGTTLLGLVFAALYVLSGSILLPIVVHALIDLRSLVLIPIVVGTAWRPPSPSPESRTSSATRRPDLDEVRESAD